MTPTPQDETRLSYCHRLLSDAVSVIDPEQHPDIVQHIQTELGVDDEQGRCGCVECHQISALLDRKSVV